MSLINPPYLSPGGPSTHAIEIKLGDPTPHMCINWKAYLLPTAILCKMNSLQVMFLLFSYHFHYFFHWVSITSEASCCQIKNMARFLCVIAFLSFWSLIYFVPCQYVFWHLWNVHKMAHFFVSTFPRCSGDCSFVDWKLFQSGPAGYPSATAPFPIAPRPDFHKGSPCHKMFTLPQKMLLWALEKISQQVYRQTFYTVVRGWRHAIL